MNPWLQRFLIAWAAGIVTTGAVVTTAKTPHKLKKKKRKKREDGTLEPVQIGATALKDARMPAERSLTVPEWRDQVVATGSAVGARVSSVFKRTPQAPAGGGAGDGAKAPDEVQGADGRVVSSRGANAASGSTSAARRKKRKGAHAKGRRGKKRAEATLWDSAKESFKQTVKESVAEEVKETPVGSAFETLKVVGARVKEGATKVGAGAAKAVNRAIEGNPALGTHEEPEELDENGIPIPRPPPAPKVPGPSLQERIDKAGAAIEKAVKGLAEGASRVGTTSTTSTTSVTSAPGAEASSEPVEPPAPLTDEEREKLAAEKAARDAAKVDVEAGAKAAAQVASEVAGNLGRKMKGGLSAVGSWLQGPGSPDYNKRRRANASGEIVEAIVEAKEAPATAVADQTSPPSPNADAPRVETASAEAAARSDEARPTPPTGVPAPVDEHAAQDFDDADGGDADFDDAEGGDAGDGDGDGDDGDEGDDDDAKTKGDEAAQ